MAGINGRGQQHITAYGEMRDVEVAWLVDPDSRLFASRSAALRIVVRHGLFAFARGDLLLFELGLTVGCSLFWVAHIGSFGRRRIVKIAFTLYSYLSAKS